MNSRTILEVYGMDRREVINVVMYLLPELTLDELEELLLNVELEFQYREDHGMIDSDEDDEDE